MEKRKPPSACGMELRARKHFETLALLSALDHAERLATAIQIAAAARIAARIVSSARQSSG